MQLGAAPARDVGERDRAGPAEAERLGDRGRPVEELGARREQLEPGLAAGELVQRQQRLERRDAAAGDDHARARAPLVTSHLLWFHLDRSAGALLCADAAALAVVEVDRVRVRTPAGRA